MRRISAVVAGIVAQALLASMTILSSCAEPTKTVEPVVLPDSGKTYVPASEWRTLPARGAGFDEGRLSALLTDISGTKSGSLHGVLIVRYGFLVFEQYNGWSREQLHTMQSVTKSVTSLLFGIANNKHPAALDVSRPVLDIFARYSSIANVDERKRALSLRNLLTMRTSMDFWEQPYPGSPLDQLNQSTGDWVKFVLDRPMIGDPGGGWAYNSGAAILMGGVLREVTGENVDIFAQRELFAPLGIASVSRARSPFDGLPHCDAEVITASGSGGQWLFVVPSLDLVVAVIAADGDGLELFYDGVLPAITR